MKRIAEDEWESRKKDFENNTKSYETRLAEIKIEVTLTVDKITQLSNPIALSALETRLEDLERERLVLENKIQNNPQDKIDVGTLIQEVVDFIPNTHKLWESGTTTEKKLLLELVFDDKITYSKKEGVRTPVFSPLYAILGNSDTTKNSLVEMAGVEPASK